MSNIPSLKQNQSAQAVTKTVDRSGLLNAQVQGINQFNEKVQSIIKQGATLIDNKMYESESASNEKKVLDFMSDSKDEAAKSDYFLKNKSMAGYHTHQAKRNMDRIEKALSEVNHPRARKELEKKLVFQAEKNLVNDLSFENRSIRDMNNLKEQTKNEVLGREVQTMTNVNDQPEFMLSVQKRIADIDNGIVEGRIDATMGQKLKLDVKDTAHTLRARALVEGGDSLSALKVTQSAGFGTGPAQVRARAYVMSKHLDGAEKQHAQLQKMNQQQSLKDKMIANQLDKKLVEIALDKNLSPMDKLEQTEALKMQAQGVIGSTAFNKFARADKRFTNEAISETIKDVNNLDAAQFNSATFTKAEERLRAMSLNTNISESSRAIVSNKLKQLKAKKAVHEKALRDETIRPFAKNPMTKSRHERILNDVTQGDKYKDLPEDGKMEIYKLLMNTKHRAAINSFRKPIKGINSDLEQEVFSQNPRKTLDLYNSVKPEMFEKIMKNRIRKAKFKVDNWFSSPAASEKDLDILYRSFIDDFHNFKNLTGGFEKEEQKILQKYESISKVANR